MTIYNQHHFFFILSPNGRGSCHCYCSDLSIHVIKHTLSAFSHRKQTRSKRVGSKRHGQCAKVVKVATICVFVGKKVFPTFHQIQTEEIEWQFSYFSFLRICEEENRRNKLEAEMKLRGGKEKKQHSLLGLFYGTVPADRPLSSARGTKGKKKKKKKKKRKKKVRNASNLA